MDSKHEQSILPLVGRDFGSETEKDNSSAPGKMGLNSVGTNGILVLATLAVIASSYFASVILVPISLSFFLFVLLEPWVDWFARKRIPRNLTAPFVVLLFLGIVSLFGWAGYGTSARLLHHLPEYAEKIRTQMASVQGKVRAIQKNTTLLPKDSNHKDVQKVEIVEHFGGSWMEYLFRGLNSIFGLASSVLLIPILTTFLLLEKSYLARQLRIAIEPKFSLDFLANEVNQMVKGFFWGNLLVGLVTTIGFLLLFLALGIENEVALSLFSGFLTLIPILGAFLGAVLPMAQCFLQFDSASPLLIVTGSSIFLHFFVANLIMPKVIGSRINVNATAATIGLIFWGWMWGGVGLLLAIPLTALIRIFFACQPSTLPWSNILAENPMGPLTRLSFSTQGLRWFKSGV